MHRCHQVGHLHLYLHLHLPRLTLPHVLERTRDADDHVRRAAYKFLAEKVGPHLIYCSPGYLST